MELYLYKILAVFLRLNNNLSMSVSSLVGSWLLYLLSPTFLLRFSSGYSQTCNRLNNLETQRANATSFCWTFVLVDARIPLRGNSKKGVSDFKRMIFG